MEWQFAAAFRNRSGDDGIAADPALAHRPKRSRQQLQAAPADAALWQSLARTYVLQGKFADAVPAYKSAIDNGADGAAVQSAYGEAQVMAASGQVTETALAAFQAALAKDAAEPRARYYLALADAQNGKLHEALDQWIKLENESVADAPWRKSLSERIDQTANTLGLDPKNLPGRGGAGPADEPSIKDLTAAARMTPAERTALLAEKTQTLAARLKHEPDDLAGLEDPGASRQVARRSSAIHGGVAAGDEVGARRIPDTWVHYAEAILANANQRGQSCRRNLPRRPSASARSIRKALKDCSSAAWLNRTPATSRRRAACGSSCLRELPEDSPQRTEIQQRLDALGGGG